MKKVSFIKGEICVFKILELLPDEVVINYFEPYIVGVSRQCIESFTAEITVKIVPYEQQ